MYDSSAERGGIPMLISSYHFQPKPRGAIGGPLQEQ